jgi:predicted component of type VI protein secretion system
MDHQTERLNAEVRRNTEARQEIAIELRQFFESRLDKLEAEMKQRIDALDKKIAQDGQALASDLSTRMYDYNEATKSNLDGILSVFETRLEKVEWQTANDQRRQLEVFAGGLSEIAGQLQGIKKVKGKGK